MADSMTEDITETPEENRAVSTLNANIGIDFSLIGTKLHATYEKKGKDGYAILLMPSEQTADNGVSIGEVIDDIKKLISSVDENAKTDQMDADLENGTSGLSKEEGFDVKKLIIKLQMAYLYIHKSGEESTLEYAFQLQIISKDVIPEAIKKLVTVDTISISIWNTERQKIMEQMALMSINEYLGIPKEKEEKEEK